MSLIADVTTHALQRSLDLRQARQEQLTSNIANVDTPYYRRKDLEFEGVLRSIEDSHAESPRMSETSDQHMSDMGKSFAAQERPVDRPDVENSLDMNTVDLDKEMARFADNAVRYNATIEMMKRRMAVVNYTIMSMGK